MRKNSRETLAAGAIVSLRPALPFLRQLLPSARSRSDLSSAGLLSADEIQFPKTKYVAQVDGKDKELNANLIFSDGLIVVKDEQLSPGVLAQKLGWL